MAKQIKNEPIKNDSIQVIESKKVETLPYINTVVKKDKARTLVFGSN